MIQIRKYLPFWLYFLIFLVSTVLAYALSAQEVPQGQATVEVHLQILPFFVVDPDGNPVTDLRQEEVRILLDGREVPVAHLDRYIFRETPPRTETRIEKEAPGKLSNAKAREPRPFPRNVFLLVDISFLDRLGYREARRIARDFTDRLLPDDRVYLLVSSDFKGLRPLWGPLVGRNEVARKIGSSLTMRLTNEKMKKDEIPTFFSLTDVETFVTNESPVQGRMGNQDLPVAQDHTRERISCSVARNLAKQIEALSLYITSLRGPKILVYLSGGIPNRLYFSNCNLSIDFEKALLHLQQAGTVSFFINPSAHRMGYSESALKDMSDKAGGVYLTGTDRAHIVAKLTGMTSAYYEAGIYIQKTEFPGIVQRVKIQIRKPGVRVVGPTHFRPPRDYRNLTEMEKIQYALELVRKAKLNVYGRDVKILRKRREKVRFKGLWARYQVLTPGSLVNREVDLYSMLMESSEKRILGKLLDAKVRTLKLRGTLEAETYLPGPGYYVWGILVLAPEKETVWLRRLLIYVPSVKKKKK